MAKIHHGRNKTETSDAIAEVRNAPNKPVPLFLLRAMLSGIFKHQLPLMHQVILRCYRNHSYQQQTASILTKAIIGGLPSSASNMPTS